MARTDHSKYQRHKNKNVKASKQGRTILRRQLANGDWENIPTQIPTHEIRTYERTGL
jgi:hypothetical protein